MTRKKPFAPWLIASCIIGLGLTASPSISLAAAESDWDKDGISDALESRLGSEPYLSDTDGDGIPDGDEVGNLDHPQDSDNDGRRDMVDIDDDNDGIPTSIEGDDEADGDGMPNHLDMDSDGDGMSDGHEVKLSNQDRDEDGVDDIFDSDITGDEDANGDGIIDIFVLHDTDKDGKPDLFDGDGKTSIVAVDQTPVAAEPAQEVEIAETPADEVVKGGDMLQEDIQADETEAELAENTQQAPVTLSAIEPPTAPASNVRYIEVDESTASDVYEGSGYFYCADSLKIVPGISRFMITPPEKTKLHRDASEGDYKWQVSEPGVYALQFQIPSGMRIVSGRVKGRRIVKETDTSPLVLGSGENPGKKGYLLEALPAQNYWYTSFEIKAGAPSITNNNIPLSGGICDQK